MIPRDPIDGPSVESEQCDHCGEPWAWEADRDHGPRRLRLCESHADAWLRGERELEEMRGRASLASLASLFGLARALDGRTRRTG